MLITIQLLGASAQIVYFDDWLLGLVVFLCVGLYSFLTIYLTNWRKQFRKDMNKKDNEWHDRITDSLVNFETVKYFTNEEYEKERFNQAVKGYQKFSVSVQASLSVLNISQQVIVNGCLAGSLVLSAAAYKSGRMSIGDFVVHVDYGIGKFAGFKRIQVKDNERNEYINVQMKFYNAI